MFLLTDSVRRRNTVRTIILCAVPIGASCSPNVLTHVDQQPSSGEVAASTNESQRGALLEVAFEAATSIPLKPHAKDRAAAQEWVVRQTIACGRLPLAQAWAAQLEGWRAGVMQCELAKAWNTSGDQPRAHACMDRVRVIAGAETEWRRESVTRAGMEAWIALGDPTEAMRLVGADAERLTIQSVAAEEATAAHATRAPGQRVASEERLELLGAALAGPLFDDRASALDAYSALYRSGDDGTRVGVRAVVFEETGQVPVMIRLRTLRQMAEADLESGRTADAGMVLAAFAGLVRETNWSCGQRVVVEADLAALQAQTGDPSVARETLSGALERFSAETRQIADIDRAEVLVACAHAAAAIPDAAWAERLFVQALEAGLINPNSRPRAQDISYVCAAAAASACGESDQLIAAARAATAQLGDPW